jgi:hypothetical protein
LSILTAKEQEVLAVFRAAEIEGRAFRAEVACYAYLEKTRKPGIDCPQYKRKVSKEAYEWHKEQNDPVFINCVSSGEGG